MEQVDNCIWNHQQATCFHHTALWKLLKQHIWISHINNPNHNMTGLNYTNNQKCAKLMRTINSIRMAKSDKLHQEQHTLYWHFIFKNMSWTYGYRYRIPRSSNAYNTSFRWILILSEIYWIVHNWNPIRNRLFHHEGVWDYRNYTGLSSWLTWTYPIFQSLGWFHNLLDSYA